MTVKKKPFLYFAVIIFLVIVVVVLCLGKILVDSTNNNLTKTHLRMLPEAVHSLFDQHQDVTDWFLQPPGTTLPRSMVRLSDGLLKIPGVPKVVVEEFRFVNGVALSLIALSAGGELRVEAVRDRFRSIATITTLQILIMFSVVATAVFLARSSIDFLRNEPPRVAFAVSLLFGLVAVAKSPATTIAVITEEKARGVFTDTVLGITVLKDVIILILIALLIPLATTIVDPAGGFSFHADRENLLEI